MISVSYTHLLSGAAKEAGASWGATFDNMGAAITRGVQSIILSIDDTQEALNRPTMRDAIKTFGSLFEKALKMIAAVLPPVIENVDVYKRQTARYRKKQLPRTMRGCGRLDRTASCTR